MMMLLAFGYASATGRAACRGEFGLTTRLVCYAEQTLWSVGPLEVASGIDLRWPGGWVTPYTAIAIYAGSWWGVVELGATVQDTQFRLALSFGVRF